MTTHVQPIFPVVLLWADIETFDKDALVEYVYQQMKDDPEGRMVSNVGGWQSDGNYHEFDNPIRKFLEDAMKKLFDRGIYKEDTKINIIQSWINVNTKGSFNRSHYHSMCDLSGTFWIKVPKKSGDIKFQNPNGFAESKMMANMNPQFREELGVHWGMDFYPTEGRVCLWPSHLYHDVAPNMSDEDRISVAFNVNVDGSNSFDEVGGTNWSDGSN